MQTYTLSFVFFYTHFNHVIIIHYIFLKQTRYFLIFSFFHDPTQVWLLRNASDAFESSLVRISNSIEKSPLALVESGESPLRWMIDSKLAPISRIFSTCESQR